MHAKGYAAAASSAGLLAGLAVAAPAGAAEPAAPAAAPTVATYAATWDRTWRNGTVRTDTTDLVQGTAAGGRNVAQVGFPSIVLPGKRIKKVEVSLYFRHWWYGSGGAADIGVHGNAVKPAKFTYSGSLTVNPWPRYTQKWTELPASWLPYFQSGTNKGVTLGGKAQASTNPVFYGRAAGIGDAYAWARPLLRVTYEPAAS